MSRPNESRQTQRVQSAHPFSKNMSAVGLNRYGSMRPEDLKRKSWAIQNDDGGLLTQENKALFDRMSEARGGSVTRSKRPMSAVTRTT